MERSVKNQNMIPSKSIDTAIIIENKDRLILFVSDTISDLFQIPLKPKDLVGLSIIQFFQSNSLLFVNESYERLLALLKSVATTQEITPLTTIRFLNNIAYTIEV